MTKKSNTKSYEVAADTTYAGNVGAKEVRVKTEGTTYETTNEAEQTLLESTFGFTAKEK